MAQMQPPPPGTSSPTALPFSTHVDQEEDPQTCLCSYDHRHRARGAHSTCRSSCSSLQPRAVLLHRRHLAPRRPSRSPRAAGHRTRARQALMPLQPLVSPATVAPGRTRDRRRSAEARASVRLGVGAVPAVPPRPNRATRARQALRPGPGAAGGEKSRPC